MQYMQRQRAQRDAEKCIQRSEFMRTSYNFALYGQFY